MLTRRQEPEHDDGGGGGGKGGPGSAKQPAALATSTSWMRDFMDRVGRADPIISWIGCVVEGTGVAGEANAARLHLSVKYCRVHLTRHTHAQRRSSIPDDHVHQIITKSSQAWMYIPIFVDWLFNLCVCMHVRACMCTAWHAPQARKAIPSAAIGMTGAHAAAGTFTDLNAHSAAHDGGGGGYGDPFGIYSKKYGLAKAGGPSTASADEHDHEQPDDLHDPQLQSVPIRRSLHVGPALPCPVCPIRAYACMGPVATLWEGLGWQPPIRRLARSCVVALHNNDHCHHYCIQAQQRHLECMGSKSLVGGHHNRGAAAGASSAPPAPSWLPRDTAAKLLTP